MKSRKKISIIILILMLLNIIQSPVQAMNIPMKETYIEDLGECERHLQYWKESAGVWSYIITSILIELYLLFFLISFIFSRIYKYFYYTNFSFLFKIF